MKRLLIVVDMQNDFITGSLGTREAQQAVEPVVRKVLEYKEKGDEVVFTLDTLPTLKITVKPRKGAGFRFLTALRGRKAGNSVHSWRVLRENALRSIPSEAGSARTMRRREDTTRLS